MQDEFFNRLLPHCNSNFPVKQKKINKTKQIKSNYTILVNNKIQFLIQQFNQQINRKVQVSLLLFNFINFFRSFRGIPFLQILYFTTSIGSKNLFFFLEGFYALFKKYCRSMREFIILIDSIFVFEEFCHFL